MFPSVSLALIALPFVSAAVHNVQVGAAGKLLYDPEAIAAQPGDQVVFHFHPKNHTVTQSSFADPCGRKEGGFNSGFQPVPANQTDNLPTYTLTVPDNEPIWMYCAQAARTPNSHCGAGMVFAINCGPDDAPNSFINFKKSALAVGAALSVSASATPAAPTTPAAAYTTAAYGGYTIPPAPVGTPVTQAVTLGQSTWTTTYTSYPGSPAPTPASLEGNVHRVIVGGSDGLVFNPPRVDAAPRDVIVFEFRQKNHTVTQSSFDDPCRRLNKDGVLGFDSGFLPVGADATTFPTFNYTVTDTAPVWAYCRQQTPASHCGAGMVFAINSDESSGRNFAAYQNVAKALNGTAAAVSNPSPTTSSTTTGGASSLKVGSIGLSLVVAIVASLL